MVDSEENLKSACMVTESRYKTKHQLSYQSVFLLQHQNVKSELYIANKLKRICYSYIGLAVALRFIVINVETV